MIRAMAILNLLLATVALNGCNTMANVCYDDPVDSKGKLPYGGTIRCAEGMKSTLFDEHFMAIPDSRALCFAFQVCDLPLSLAADTVLLPFTVPYTLANSLQPSGDRRPTPEELEPSWQPGAVGPVSKSQE